MRKPKELPEGALESLAKGLKQAKTKAQFQSVQCLWLRASLGLTADQVATAIGWHPNSVRKLQARYFKEGEAALKRGGRGGRYYQNLTLEEERQLLQEFLAQSERGGILEVSRVKAAYEQALGRQVPKSTVYRMLARHGWRKVLPGLATLSQMPPPRRLLKKLAKIVEQEVMRQGQRGRQLRLMFQDEARFAHG